MGFNFAHVHALSQSSKRLTAKSFYTVDIIDFFPSLSGSLSMHGWSFYLENRISSLANQLRIPIMACIDKQNCSFANHCRINHGLHRQSCSFANQLR